MPTYYVNTNTGSNANDGSSWALAWKTTEPLKALYTGSSITGVEIRFAKTPTAVHSAITVTAGTPNLGDYAYVPVADMTGLTNGSMMTTGLSLYWIGWTVVSPVTEASSVGNISVQPIALGTVPAGFSGKACYSGFTTRSLASYYGIELVCTIVNAAHLAGFACDLKLCSDSLGNTPVASFPVVFPAGPVSAFAIRVGEGSISGLTSVSSVALYMTNTAGVDIAFGLGSVAATKAVSSTGYWGCRALYVPSNNTQIHRAVVSSGSYSEVFFDSLELETGSRTYTSYVSMDSYPSNSRLNSSIVTFGTSASPIKLLGGWNTATDTVDGVTCLDASQLFLMTSACTSASVEVKKLAILRPGLARAEVNATWGVLGASSAITLNACVAEDVWLASDTMESTGRLDSEAYKWTATLIAGDITVGPLGVSSLRCRSSVSVWQVSRYVTRALGGPVTHSYCFFYSYRGKWYTNSSPAIRPSFDNCYFMGVNSVFTLSPYNVRYGDYTDYTDCIIRMLPTSGGLCGIGSNNVFTRCAFYGDISMPFGDDNVYIQPIIEHTGNNQISLMYDSVGYSMNRTRISGAIAHTPATTGWTGGAIIKCVGAGSFDIRDSVFSINCASFMVTNALLSCTISVLMSNVTFDRNTGTGMTALSFAVVEGGSAIGQNKAIVVLEDLVFSGPWAVAILGDFASTIINRITCTHASTIPFTHNWGHGRAIFSNLAGVNLRNVSAVNAIDFNMSDAYYPSGLLSVDSEGISGTYSPTFTLTEDATEPNTTSTSWKYAITRTTGNRVVNEIQLGVFYVYAGNSITISIQTKRSSSNSSAFLYIRPLFTKTSGFTDIIAVERVLISMWSTLSITYTPDKDGAIEVYMSATGYVGSSVWFDAFSVTQA